MGKKLFLLDAMALIYRAYYSMIRHPIITTKGRTTNAQFGFTNTLLDLIQNQKPTHLAVAFDTSAPTARHLEFEKYKAQRQEVPEDISGAIPDIKKIVKGFNLPVIEMDGYEADDIIGTLAGKAEKQGFEVYMVTPDKDFGQLVTDNVLIYKPGYQGSNVEILGKKEVCERWNIKDVNQVIDILGLMGDASDNIPGVPGVGEKTAAKLLSEYNTLENVLANAENIKGALGNKIREGKDLAILSKKLATIITDAPIEFNEEKFKVGKIDKQKLNEIFTELEFKSLGKRVLGDEYSVFEAAPTLVQAELFSKESDSKPSDVAVESTNGSGLIAEKNIHNTTHQYHLVQTKEEIKQLVSELINHPEISFDTETTGLDANTANLVGMSFSYKPYEAYYVPIPQDRQLALEILHEFKSLFDDDSKKWIGQNLKFDLLILKWYGMDLHGALFDTMLAHYLIESDSRRNMDLLSAQYLGYVPVSITELIGKKEIGRAHV